MTNWEKFWAGLILAIVAFFWGAGVGESYATRRMEHEAVAHGAGFYEHSGGKTEFYWIKPGFKPNN